MAPLRKSVHPKKRGAPQNSISSAPATKKSKVQIANKRRPVPVTTHAPPTPESEGSYGESGQDGDTAMEGSESESEAGTSDRDIGAAKASKPVKDPQAASKESHKAQKELQAQRRAVKPHSTLLTEAKRVWASARKIDIPRTERQKHIVELMGVLRGNVQDIVFKHDASRIVQTLVKYGGQKERDEVAAELKGKYRDLAQNKYGKFLVTKLIRYCNTHRGAILSEFHNHVIRLLLHREASPIIADAYELYASAIERNLLLRDFYGKEATLFDSATIQKASQANRGGLRGALENATPERKRRILGSMAESLMLIFNNPDKGAVSHAIVHRVLWEYLSELALLEESDKEEVERLRRSVFDSCQELLAEMVHTKDGSRAVREFIARGTAKDRKQVLKVLKPHVEKMCANEEAQLVLFTIFDLVDDTKLVGKSIVADIASLSSSLSRTLARRILLYLLVPRTSRHFTPALLRTIAQTDFAQGVTSKKDPRIRTVELRLAASPGMIKAVEENAEALVRDRGASVFVGEVMLFAEGDKTKALKALLAPISSPYTPPEPNSDLSDPTVSTHILNLSHASRLYKSLVQGGHFNQQTKQIELAEYAPRRVASAFMNAAGHENVLAMALGEGGFVIAEVIGKLKEEGDKDNLEQIRSWFGNSTREKLKKGNSRGSMVLLQRLDE
ncbi:Pumilio like domain containing protein [Ceratobasidium theobromae]|uniref:Pumilio like domain containing protein n=1 Tax=Ceratobasidium theobromae TaxID=1582974 RepID=A0A5N5QFW6_9AGAM|nr:Pumilio like domain containing protein [Ceratobasidium theobromae]